MDRIFLVALIAAAALFFSHLLVQWIRRVRKQKDWERLMANAKYATDYGADPTGRTDSTTAIQAAIDDAVMNPTVLPSGKRASLVCLGNGTYQVGSLHELGGHVILTREENDPQDV